MRPRAKFVPWLEPLRRVDRADRWIAYVATKDRGLVRRTIRRLGLGEVVAIADNQRAERGALILVKVSGWSSDGWAYPLPAPLAFPTAGEREIDLERDGRTT